MYQITLVNFESKNIIYIYIYEVKFLKFLIKSILEVVTDMRMKYHIISKNIIGFNK